MRNKRGENEAAEATEAEKLRRLSKRKRDSDNHDEYWDRWNGRTAGLQIGKEHRHLGIGTIGDDDDRSRQR